LAEKFQFQPEAIEQINESYEYYENNKKGLGDLFLKEVREKAIQISSKPLSNPIISKDIRRTGMRKPFPFFIYYAFRDAIVQILAIWHKKREKHPKLDDK